tara:strand:+ start:539 stop:706 length:168 start_codon:yes stop_codon:yes gene_type:complete
LLFFAPIKIANKSKIIPIEKKTFIVILLTKKQYKINIAKIFLKKNVLEDNSLITS